MRRRIEGEAMRIAKGIGVLFAGLFPALVMAATAQPQEERALAPELPPHARWSKRPPPVPTVLLTFMSLRLESDYDVCEGDPAGTFGNWDGVLRGIWYFSGGDVRYAPTRYVRFEPGFGESGTVEVSWACEDTPQACREFVESIPGLVPPPPPPPPAPGEMQAHRD